MILSWVGIDIVIMYKKSIALSFSMHKLELFRVEMVNPWY